MVGPTSAVVVVVDTEISVKYVVQIVSHAYRMGMAHRFFALRRTIFAILHLFMYKYAFSVGIFVSFACMSPISQTRGHRVDKGRGFPNNGVPKRNVKTNRTSKRKKKTEKRCAGSSVHCLLWTCIACHLNAARTI